MQPRYQIFTSSTFRDLERERQAVLDAVWELGHFAVGMEVFPAANSTPWELIRRMIEESDYYVLIIGGRYGSRDENGVSYTEREYDLAVELKKPVLAFLHENPDEIPSGKTDQNEAVKAKLEQFRTKVRNAHHVKFWKSTDDLKSKVIVGLVGTFATTPATGWVKASGFNKEELLSKLVNLQQKHDDLSAENEALRTRLNEDTEIHRAAKGSEKTDLIAQYSLGDNVSPKTIIATWDEIFFAIAEELTRPSSKHEVENALNQHFLQNLRQRPDYTPPKVEANRSEPGEELSITEPNIEVILRQFLAINLVQKSHAEMAPSQDPFGLVNLGGMRTWWMLTPKGERKFLERVIIPSQEGTLPNAQPFSIRH